MAAQTPAAAPSQTTAPRSAPIKTGPTDSTVALKSVEVEKTVAGVFGDTAAISLPLIDAVPSSGPTWDIDVRSYEGQERVAFYVNLFTQASRNRFQEKLRQGTRYEPMIRAKLKAGGIPEDMMYLAMVESGYDPNAYSSAAAVGMWQFMSSTARDVGLRVDWWVDERRDPARSTDAAIRFLGDLQSQFGSLYLAAAAYNGGPGRVSRGLTRFAEDMEGSTGEDRFFALAEHDYLRSETKNYVPQIIAAALVGKEPVRYGFAFDTLAQYQYDSVEVAAGTPLAAIATASAVDVGTIKELNPSVLRGMVPPTGSLWIRVPMNGTVATTDIATALSALPDGDRIGYRTVKTTGSESSASIASKAGIGSKQLAWYNPGLKSTKKGKLLAGQSVRVPIASVVAAALSVPDPSIERYGSSTVAATKSGTVHIVKRGETLGKVSERFNVSVAKLRSLNGLRSDKLVAGQAIRVRAATVTRAGNASRSVATRSSSAKPPVGKTTSGNTTSAKTSAARSSKPRTAATSNTSGRSAAVNEAPAKRPARKSASLKKPSTSKPAAKATAASPTAVKAPVGKTASKTTTPKKSGP
ncbi:MAG: transglycosylase SLT domain-containing protein [Gemmatimonas sp.]